MTYALTERRRGRARDKRSSETAAYKNHELNPIYLVAIFFTKA